MAAQFRGQVAIIGGSGFVGRYAVKLLAQKGWQIKVICRHPDLAGFLQPLGGVGQIHAVQANIRNARSIREAIRGSDAIVNLAGILSQQGRQTFDEVHIEGARRVAEAAKTYEIANYVYVSALGANPKSKSLYARSKAKAERKTFEICESAVILRPSLIFGEEDAFFNRFAAMARYSPFLPAIGSGRTRFQPVYVGDVAKAIMAALEGRAKPGKTYELGGPDIFSLKELLHLSQRYSGRKPRTLPIPFAIAMLKGAVLQVLPKKLLTMDQVRLLRDDCLVSARAKREGLTLEHLGITPTNIDSVVPVYLEKFRPKGMFEHYKKPF